MNAPPDGFSRASSLLQEIAVLFVGASLLAMDVNENAGCLDECAA